MAVVGGLEQRASVEVAEDAARVRTSAELARVLRRLRRRRARQDGSAELSYRELAARTGWSHGVIGDYLAGKVLPPTDRFDILTRLLGATPAEQGALATARDRVEDQRFARDPAQATFFPAAFPTAYTNQRPTPPALLPPDVAGFTGRRTALEQLGALLAHHYVSPPTATMISTVVGTAGVGKTALAVHWAHQVRDRFPDGQLYIDLNGYASQPPLRPIDALARLLYALGVPTGEVPIVVDDAVGLYRSMLAGKRVLVLLDNARHPDQVRPLLPAWRDCVVVVTSRERLIGLVARNGATRVTLGVLEPVEAETLLAYLLGAARVEAEPDAAKVLAELCGYLPLAVRIAAANLAADPHRGIASHVAQLHAGNRLAALEVAGDPQAAIRAAFDLSYAMLSAPARRLFRLVALVPEPAISAAAAAALAELPPADATALLDHLLTEHLIDPVASDQYGMHDLLRLYGTEKSAAEDRGPDRRAALNRLHDFYLQPTVSN